MNNYIRSEIYRIVRAKGTYIFAGILIGAVVLLNIVLWGFGTVDPKFRYNTTNFAFSNLYSSMQLVMILCICLVSVIFGQEYKNNTLKNTVSFGISRGEIYLGKLFISLIYALILTTLVISTFIGSAYLLLKDSGVEHLNLMLNGLISGIPIFLFCIVLANALYFIIERESNVFMVWSAIIVIIPLIIARLGMKSELCSKIASYLPFNMFSNITWGENVALGWTTPEGLIKVLVVSGVGIILFYAIGIIGFKKKEIK